METKSNTPRRWTDRLFGALPMGWLTVVLLAVAAALLTAVFLIVPAFKNTSFERMGVYLEAWVFFAVLIMANSKKPLESACKTFVFFLISQPLIYLFQVPFSWLGWGIFRYYKRWFILTLLTFPAAYAGWYITRRNWLSVLILAPVLALLGWTGWECAQTCLRHFPQMLFATLFCLAQIVLYAAAFLPGGKKLVGLAVPVIAAVILALTSRGLGLDASVFLPDEPVLTESAAVVMEEDGGITVSVENTGEDSMVRVQADRFGAADFRIQDGENEYLYTVEVYEDEGGHSQIRVTRR